MKVRFIHSVEIPGWQGDPVTGERPGWEKGTVIDSGSLPGNYLKGWLSSGICVEDQPAVIEPSVIEVVHQ